MYKKIERLLKAAKAYYVDSKPIMSDQAYDNLYKQVREWEIEQEIENKLTDKICLGYFEGDKTEKIKHYFPMLSVENDNVRAIDKAVVITPKIDGAAIELVYVNGVLYQKLTRGDGEYGSDITKVKIHNIPETILTRQHITIIRGEATCPTYKEYGKSHRNVVAGSLGRVDFEEDRGLYFSAYWTNLFNLFDFYLDELAFLKESGFIIPQHILVNGPIDLTNDFMKDLPYPIDGYVLRYNANQHYGEKTAHHYKGIWCWKCYGDEQTSTIIDVEWNKSKNGIWTPVAILEPIELEESTVSRVNLMHLDYISDKDIAIGDKVLVHKAKGIIPEIKEVVERVHPRNHPYLIYCPDCGSDLVQDGVYLKCENLECSKDKFIEFFCKTIGIKGLALKNIEKLNLKHPLDLYSLTNEKLVNRLGKIGDKIYEEIQESKNVPVVKILAALNPPGAKVNTLTTIFNEFPKLDVIGDIEKLVSIKGIADKKATKLVNWYRNILLPLLPVLVNIGFSMVPEVSKIKMEIAVTGTFPMKREDFKTFMGSKGIEVKNLTKKSKLLITGDKPSASKITKANKYKIPVVPYIQFVKDLSNYLT
jgi:DNA ligase (NAD+)